MNHDDRLQHHLRRQADAIGLSPADPAPVMRRGTRRRNRRRGAVVAMAALAVVAASISIVDRGDPRTVESGVAAAVVASPFDWTVVSPQTGLGYLRSSATLDGQLYSLSTAPGERQVTSSFEPHLYRSDDGAEWAEVSLPEDMQPSSLTAAAGTLYALGTAPAGGGGRDLVMSASSDGAGTWTEVVLPGDVAALEARHPGQVTLSRPAIAALDAHHIVASVVVSATPDVPALLPGIGADAGWEITPDGVTVYEPEPCSTAHVRCAGSPSTLAPAAGADPSTTTTEAQKVAATYTWDELGLDPELQALIPGRAYVYSTDDGADFERADLPADAIGWGGQVLATPDGYRLFLGAAGPKDSTTSVLRSTDGHAWTAAGQIPGAPQSVGLLGDRPAVAVAGSEDIDVLVGQPDGTWVPLDIRSAVDAATQVYDVAFGPLGVAAILGGVDEASEIYVVHSADGSALSAVALADHVDGPAYVVGVSVSADAILVRLGGPDDGDPATAPTQRVLVGTPR